MAFRARKVSGAFEKQAPGFGELRKAFRKVILALVNEPGAKEALDMIFLLVILINELGNTLLVKQQKKYQKECKKYVKNKEYVNTLIR